MPIARQSSGLLYDALDVAKDATPAQIKKAYHKKALLLHPDKTGGTTTEEFKIVQEANAILSDPEKRKLYDVVGRAGLKYCEQFEVHGAAATVISNPKILIVAIVYFLLFFQLALLFIVLACVKEDYRKSWSWRFVFIPLYVLLGVYIVPIGTGLFGNGLKQIFKCSKDFWRPLLIGALILVQCVALVKAPSAMDAEAKRFADRSSDRLGVDHDLIAENPSLASSSFGFSSPIGAIGKLFTFGDVVAVTAEDTLPSAGSVSVPPELLLQSKADARAAKAKAEKDARKTTRTAAKSDVGFRKADREAFSAWRGVFVFQFIALAMYVISSLATLSLKDIRAQLEQESAAAAESKRMGGSRFAGGEDAEIAPIYTVEEIDAMTYTSGLYLKTVGKRLFSLLCMVLFVLLLFVRLCGIAPTLNFYVIFGPLLVSIGLFPLLSAAKVLCCSAADTPICVRLTLFVFIYFSAYFSMFTFLMLAEFLQKTYKPSSGTFSFLTGYHSGSEDPSKMIPPPTLFLCLSMLIVGLSFITVFFLILLAAVLTLDEQAEALFNDAAGMSATSDDFNHNNHNRGSTNYGSTGGTAAAAASSNASAQHHHNGAMSGRNSRSTTPPPTVSRFYQRQDPYTNNRNTVDTDDEENVDIDGAIPLASRNKRNGEGSFDDFPMGAGTAGGGGGENNSATDARAHLGVVAVVNTEDDDDDEHVRPSYAGID